MAEKYLLRVTAGPAYDESTHVVLPVNAERPTKISSAHCTARVNVRVQNYRGLPRTSPQTSPYFSSEPHTHDQYSIGFDFVPHESVSGENLVFGNDFDRPIRDRLPPGFSTAFKIVKWAVDPSLDGDVYSDKPYLYGPALASLNVVKVGAKAQRGEKGSWEVGEGQGKEGLEEGAEGDGAESRLDSGVPETAAGRKKWALTEENRESWQWEAGRMYRADFFNPYLDFNSFSLKLPGFSINVLAYMDGKDTLRYVLKDKETDNLFFVVVFTLVLKEDAAKEEAEEAMKGGGGAAAAADAGNTGEPETTEDDVD